MKKKHLLIIGTISLMVALLVTAYSSNVLNIVRGSTAPFRGNCMALSEYLSFEDAVTRATRVVVAEFVEKRPFGLHFTEFEFIVHEQVIGNVEDTIFVYLNHAEMCCVFMDGTLQFTTDTQYLLVLWETADVYASFHIYGLRFFTDLIVDLDDPSRSTMYGEPLS